MDLSNTINLIGPASSALTASSKRSPLLQGHRVHLSRERMSAPCTMKAAPQLGSLLNSLSLTKLWVIKEFSQALAGSYKTRDRSITLLYLRSQGWIRGDHLLLFTIPTQAKSCPSGVETWPLGQLAVKPQVFTPCFWKQLQTRSTWSQDHLGHTHPTDQWKTAAKPARPNIQIT